ncbi:MULTISPECIES: zinc-binding dehydrogenase [Sphingobacterium]|uniref:zinc-binding dehydrogenase n=1 Tax=Sphingobacterium TaxID=28453 RepID=UPI00257C9852|nr:MULTISPECIES: zinc-binding dehydrogenase [Sphingobacterium]
MKKPSKKTHFEDVLYDVNFVLEAIGGINFQKSVQVLKPFGTIVTLPSVIPKRMSFRLKKNSYMPVVSMSVYSSGRDMQKIASLLENGILKPHISHVFGFDEMAKAHLQIETGRTVGKIVVTL